MLYVYMWEESRLFDMYRLYLNNRIDRQSFIDI